MNNKDIEVKAQTKEAIVIDKNGYKVEFILVRFYEENGVLASEPLFYEPKPGESFVYDDVGIALSMLKPQRVKGEWKETATPEEIAASIPEQVLPPADPRDLAMAELTEMVIEGQLQTDLALSEIFEMITGG